MTMGTRIIVMDQGRIQQDGTPKEIYDRPANTFVARFIGQPPMNLFETTVQPDGVHIPGAGTLGFPPAAIPAQVGERIILGVRAERISVTPDGPGLVARVAAVEQLGGETVIGFRWEREEDDGHIHRSMRGLYYAKMAGDVSLPVDGPCRVRMDTDGSSWFDHGTGRRSGEQRTEEAR
jgi:multiple sugar transport system ATP-binding protein